MLRFASMLTVLSLSACAVEEEEPVGVEDALAAESSAGIEAEEFEGAVEEEMVVSHLTSTTTPEGTTVIRHQHLGLTGDLLVEVTLDKEHGLSSVLVRGGRVGGASRFTDLRLDGAGVPLGPFAVGPLFTPEEVFAAIPDAVLAQALAEADAAWGEHDAEGSIGRAVEVELAALRTFGMDDANTPMAQAWGVSLDCADQSVEGAGGAAAWDCVVEASAADEGPERGGWVDVIDAP